MNISVPAFKDIVHSNEWNDSSFVGHSSGDQGGHFRELKDNLSWFPKISWLPGYLRSVKRVATPLKSTTNAVFFIQQELEKALKIKFTYGSKNWIRDSEVSRHLEKFNSFYQSRQGLFTKAEFKQFCQKNKIEVPE